jgi:hypothetical protein
MKTGEELAPGEAFYSAFRKRLSIKYNIHRTIRVEAVPSSAV